MRSTILLVLSLLVISAFVLAHGATWYVDDSVSESGDGTSWDNAFKEIQEGIDSALDGDTVMVDEGTYVENISFKAKRPKNIVLRSTDPLNSGLVANTIIDGNRAGPVVTFAGTENEACVLSGLTITNGTLGIWGGDTHAAIQHNVITGNSGTGIDGCDGIIRNNVIARNLWGAISYSDGTIENNTIYGNSAPAGGGLDRCNGIIRNCIIWGNTASREPQLSGSVIPAYSCIQDWLGGGDGNIAEDPRFVDPDGADNDPDTYEDNDYRLSAESPCIDAGRNEDWMWRATDHYGNNRIFYGTSSRSVDMGAYEYGSFPFRISRILMMLHNETLLFWTSRPGDLYSVCSCTDPSTDVWNIEATVASQGATTFWTGAMPSGPAKFYRVHLK